MAGASRTIAMTGRTAVAVRRTRRGNPAGGAGSY